MNRKLPLPLIGTVIVNSPRLLYQLGGRYLLFKRQAKKSGRYFQKKLIDEGIDKKTAQRLSQIYLESSKMNMISAMKCGRLLDARDPIM